MPTSSTPRWWYAFVASLLLGVGLGACFEPATVICRTGLVCPPDSQCSVDGASCTSNDGCGNGRVDTGETCDDGNQTDGDGCSADCRSDEKCANGVIDDKFGAGDRRNEACDDRNKIPGDGCSADCKSKEVCGNGILDFTVGEVCDDGNVVAGDGCSADCRSTETCGNGVIDRIKGEECDFASPDAGTRCSPECKNQGCGNGIIDPGEACDDNNTSDGDGCSHDCLSTEICGNHIPDPFMGEVCDDGNRDGGDGCSADCRSLETCGNGITDRAIKPDGGFEICDDGNRDAGDGCAADCKSTEACGNRIVDVAVGEVCDDGNRAGGDGCSADCRSNETCGNRIIDLTKRDGGIEQCDDGPAGSTRCSPACLLRYCGNGIPDPGEACDDGNQVSGDGCEPNCQLTGTCGNGKLDVGEQCDDGNPSSTDSCIACKFAVCGDGFVQVGVEACDTKGMSASCNADCTIPRCGDGIVNAFRGEQCDILGNGGIGPDGGLLGGESAGCDQDCTAAYCGDGVTNTTRREVCDDGNTSDSDACLSTCQPAACGDGFLQAGVEQCDDGNASACGTCSATCAATQPRHLASGGLVAVAPALVHDTDSFVLDDGVTTPVTFELDTSTLPAVGPGRVRIDAVSPRPDGGAGTADDVADTIVAAITSVSSLKILAGRGAGSGVVTLSNTALGGLGNRPILWSGTTPGFQVSGMSGGVALDCGAGVGCTSNDDCQGVLRCKPTGLTTVLTCQP
jgi:cysteine-rich repeat protein